MALIDVSFLLTDPDFCDSAELIARASSVNEYGEHVLIETTMPVTVVVQAPTADTLKFLPSNVAYSDTVDVWMTGAIDELHTQARNGYSDVLLWGGKRYIAIVMVEDFTNFGTGYTHAIFAAEPLHA